MNYHPGPKARFGNVIRYLPSGDHVMFLGWRDPAPPLGIRYSPGFTPSRVWYGLRLQYKIGGKHVTQNASSVNWLTVDR